MPPRSKKAAAADGDDAPRRSSRIKDQPKPDPPKKKAPAKPRVKKAAKDAEAGDENKKRPAEDGAADEPAAKKAKPASKAGSAKPASKAEAKDEAAADGAAVPETIAEEDEGEGAKALGVGDVLPDLTLQNEKGEDVAVGKLTAERGVVLFLFPKADTPGCNKQACAFRDNYAAFTELGYDVYGLSGDTGAAQAKWQTKNNLPYSFLSDPKKELIKALGAWAKSTKRSHFVVEKGGKIIDKKLPVKPEESYSLALEAIKSHAS